MLLINCATEVFGADALKVKVNAGKHDRISSVVSFDISKYAPNTNSVLLQDLSGNKKNVVPCQVVSDKSGKTVLYWIASGTIPAGTTRTYSISFGKKQAGSPTMSIEDNHKALVLKKEGHPILAYNYTVTPAPEGVDPAFSRSGYIHPAWSPSGNVLTNIQPKDHRHHYGIWNPWTHVIYDGTLYDLWNLGDKQGTVRARDIVSTYQGDVFNGYDANLDHVIFTPKGEKLIMKECWKVKSWDVPEGFLWDFESDLVPTSLPIILREYRYAGFGYRATADWTKSNCIMMTSEGKSRQQIDGTRARWIYITGQCANGKSGLLFLGHPDNYNAPQPLRIWDENANGGRGDAFINFAPTKNEDWQLQPGYPVRLRYRVFVYDGEMTSARAEQLWQDYADPAIVAPCE